MSSGKYNSIHDEIMAPWVPLVDNTATSTTTTGPNASPRMPLPLLFYQGYFHNTGYRVAITDLEDRLWVEEMTSDAICERVESSEFAFDVAGDAAQMKILLRQLNQSLGLSSARTIVQCDSECIVLKVLTEPLFTWSFHLTRWRDEEFRVPIVGNRNIGLLCLVDTLLSQVQGLQGILAQKDYHINHLLTQFHDETGRAYIPRRYPGAVREFDSNKWLHEWKALREDGEGSKLVSIDTVAMRSVGKLSNLWGFTASGKGVLTPQQQRPQPHSESVLPRLSLTDVSIDDDITTDDDETGDEYSAIEPLTSNRTSDLEVVPSVKTPTIPVSRKRRFGLISGNKAPSLALSSSLPSSLPSSPPSSSSSQSILMVDYSQPEPPLRSKKRQRRWGIISGRKKASSDTEDTTRVSIPKDDKNDHHEAMTEFEVINQQADERRQALNARLLLSRQQKAKSGTKMSL